MPTSRETSSPTRPPTPHVEVHSFVPRPAGPFPRGSFEVLFTREAFADYVTWLAFERPQTIDVLVHPLTDSAYDDHTRYAVWLGAPVALKLGTLRQSYGAEQYPTHRDRSAQPA